MNFAKSPVGAYQKINYVIKLFTKIKYHPRNPRNSPMNVLR